jgi:predicted transcriptional regulator
MIPADHRPAQSHTSLRMDARLDATTRAKVDEFATRFRQPRAAVVCHIMHWGLSRGQGETFDGGGAEGSVRHLYCYVDIALHDQVEKAANAASMKMAPWLRAMVRQITIADVPARWQAARSEERSHDSRTYGTRFMLRLDSPSATKLQQLVRQFGTSKADIIRQLIAQATPEDFPNSWHMRAAERSVSPM